jgi:opacity protein-like surface antigen
MRNKFWKGIAALAAVVAGAGAAGAADLAVKAPVYKAPPVILSDWSGFYIGINGGYGWGDTKFDDDSDFLNTKPKGGLFGGHAGYNWQYGKVVTGVEIDFDGASIKSTDILFANSDIIQSQTVKFDELATARARLGYALLPDLLAYGTAGIAWGHSKLTATENVNNQTLNIQTMSSLDANVNNFGWAAGAGLEYYLGHGFIVRAEYLHYDFAKTTYSFPTGFSTNAATTIDAVRGGLSYKF